MKKPSPARIPDRPDGFSIRRAQPRKQMEVPVSSARACKTLVPHDVENGKAAKHAATGISAERAEEFHPVVRTTPRWRLW
jgi:hypothetical protein